MADFEELHSHILCFVLTVPKPCKALKISIEQIVSPLSYEVY